MKAAHTNLDASFYAYYRARYVIFHFGRNISIAKLCSHLLHYSLLRYFNWKQRIYKFTFDRNYRNFAKNRYVCVCAYIYIYIYFACSLTFYLKSIFVDFLFLRHLVAERWWFNTSKVKWETWSVKNSIGGEIQQF